MLISLPVDVGLTPWAQAQGSDVVNQLTALTDAFNTALKSLGEGMSSMARKQ